MAVKLMYIPKDETQNSVDYNKWLKHLYTELNKPTNENVMKVPKIFKQTNKKTLLLDFED